MARVLGELTHLAEGALLATTVVLGVRAYNRYRLKHRRSVRPPAVVCEQCGETQPLEQFLDPAVTCSCVASNDCHDPRLG